MSVHTAGRGGTGVQSHFTVVADEANFAAAAESIHSIGARASILAGTGTTLVQIYLTVIALNMNDNAQIIITRHKKIFFFSSSKVIPYG